MNGTVYGVYDPRRPATCVYVGQTYTRLERRLSRHVASALQGRTRPFYDWLRDRLASFEKPIIAPLLSGLESPELAEIEQFFIAKLVSAGHPLLNKEAIG